MQLAVVRGRRRAEIEARGERIELELPYSEPHNLLNTLAAVAAARALGVAPWAARVDVRFSSLRGEVVELPGGVDGRQRLLQRQPDVDAGGPRPPRRSARRAPDRGARARWPSWARTPAATTARSASTPAELGIDLLVTVGEQALAYADGFDGETQPVATPEEAGALLEELARPGDRVLVKGSRSVGLERVLSLGDARRDPDRPGTASLLICMFLGPKFIDFLRAQEFGQHIREEGPEGHHGKAGTPTMGGLVIFLSSRCRS